ncbi:BnaCnng33720D [Brassica napus]|uniref:BnaCnng33720D protein n=1 Tax=Brassica napus TaxID=3708 RepID=A0A078J6T3_BRANA|nr:BnaCnng33720D [Brassica napus]
MCGLRRRSSGVFLRFEVRQVFIRCGQVPQNRKHKLYKGTAIRGGIQERLIRKFPETNWRTLHDQAKVYELQAMFAGEATYITHYSTIHGAYFHGFKEANRLLKH